MNKQEQPKRASQAVIKERLDQLADWKLELALAGKDLTAQMIMERFNISRRQADRYRAWLKEREPAELQQRSGPTLANSFLQSLPLINHVLRQDLERLNQMSSDSESESLALIKARKEQALALAKTGGQFLKELRDLGLLGTTSTSDQHDSDRDEIEQSENSQLQDEIIEAVERELLEFERELEKAERPT